MEANRKLLTEKLSGRNSSRTFVEIPTVLSARADSTKPSHVKIVEFKGLKKNLSISGSKIREEIKNAPIEQKGRIKLNYALKHLAEQKSKGNVILSARGSSKTPSFEPHELPEINSILYGFEYKEDGPIKIL